MHTINKRRSEDKTDGIISIDAEVFVRSCVCACVDVYRCMNMRHRSRLVEAKNDLIFASKVCVGQCFS